MNTAEIEVFPALTGELHPGRKPERLRAPASAAGQQADRRPREQKHSGKRYDQTTRPASNAPQSPARTGEAHD
jgi:hypothetical protein